MKSKKLLVMLLAITLVAIMLATPAAAATVTFRVNTGTVYSWSNTDTSTWVGPAEYNMGIYVRIAQASVKACGYSVGTVDGVYGPSTNSGIKAFQKAYNLDQDGIVGKDSWLQLYNLKGWYGTTGTTLSW